MVGVLPPALPSALSPPVVFVVYTTSIDVRHAKLKSAKRFYRHTLPAQMRGINALLNAVYTAGEANHLPCVNHFLLQKPSVERKDLLALTRASFPHIELYDSPMPLDVSADLGETLRDSEPKQDTLLLFSMPGADVTRSLEQLAELTVNLSPQSGVGYAYS